MGTLIYPANVSLDGWTEDAEGGFAWAPPDDEVFEDLTALMASATTYLYGRRLYEVMAVWETDPSLAEASGRAQAFASAWQRADKVVWSEGLAEPVTARTRLERAFDPEVVRRAKEEAAGALVVGGPHLAAQAMAAGLVDELRLYVWPVVLGGRNPALPTGGRVALELLDERRLGAGVVRLTYRVLPAA